MEKLTELYKQLNLIEEQFLLIPQKANYFDEIRGLNDNVKEISGLQNLIKQLIDEHESTLRKEYKELTKIISKTTLLLIYALENIETDKNKTAVAAKDNYQEENRNENAKHSVFDPTPSRIKISEYAKSPMVKQKSSKALMFSEFDADISQNEFDNIPSYMRGRLGRADLQDFLDNIIIKCFNFKYEIYFKSRSCLKTGDFNLQTTYKQQANYFEDNFFITIGDISRIQNKNVDKKDEKMIQSLRFLKIIKEVRKNGVVCYLWLK